MKKFIFIFILIVFFGILQSSVFFDVFKLIGAAKPDIILMLVVFVAYKKGSMEGQMVGFGAGLFVGIFSTALFGLNPFIYTLIGFLMGLVEKKIYADSFLTSIVLIFFATIIKGAIIGILALFYGEIAGYYISFLRNALLIELIINPLFAVPIFWTLKRFALPVLR
ncbi:MAG: rod shape-determining protein MreD [Spirochaetes bacterium]|nr:rod shape-determining protein MreD [Spirochaetota bacterium]MCK5267763.1 rod shape-determining protein MreD [Spirochaetota bacterium]